MQLKFLNQLSESQLIDLVNYIIAKRNAINYKSHQAKQIKIFCEKDRCDLEGNQQIYIQTTNGNIHTGDFDIQDFSMLRSFTHEDFSQELREFMTSIFGEKYLNALTRYYKILASKESKRLRTLYGNISL